METLKGVTEGGVLFAGPGFIASDLKQNIVIQPVARGYIERDVVEIASFEIGRSSVRNLFNGSYLPGCVK